MKATIAIGGAVACYFTCDDLITEPLTGTGDDEIFSDNVLSDIVDGNGKPRRKSAKERRERQRREPREEKHGDPDWEEPASEDCAKWKAGEAEKRGGREEHRRGHDEKRGAKVIVQKIK